MARQQPNKAPTAVARCRLIESKEPGKFIVEILLATQVTDEKRMHVLMSRAMKSIGQIECEVVAMDELDADFAFRKLEVKEVHA